LSPPVMPAPRRYASMEYDVESDRIILFGGILGTGGTTGDTWAFDYDTNTWENMNPSSAPSSRMYSVMAYDSESDRIILFSGCYPGVFTDTWAYDYNTNTWQNMNPSENPGAYPGGLVYDAEEDLCIMYGGAIDFDETQLSNETWAYSYNTNTWTEYTVSTTPGIRTRAKLVYDHNSDVTILYGGLGQGRFDEMLNDTWSFASLEPTTILSVDGNVDWTLVLIAAGAGVVIIVMVVLMRRR
ncbi:MAG: kelch repeat-containing protein, partial [Promethearchaeota archaeon]